LPVSFLELLVNGDVVDVTVPPGSGVPEPSGPEVLTVGIIALWGFASRRRGAAERL
jgi:hypothetical protein